MGGEGAHEERTDRGSVGGKGMLPYLMKEILCEHRAYD